MMNEPDAPLLRPDAASVKVLSREQLLRQRDAARAAGRTVVHCHGCFDIVHPGHIRHLRQARSHGDILLVSITGDPEVKKGNGRPLIPEELRAENLAALDLVDWVYVEHRATARELLDEVRPDVYVKGREYETNRDERFRAERETVERHGGRVVFTSGDVVFSSSALIAAMERSADPFHAALSRLVADPRLEGSLLTGLVSRFRQKRVVIVGETVVDTYRLCDRPEVAGETPTLTLRPVEHRCYDGGAAGIARQAAAMGASPVLVTALPETMPARALVKRLEGEGIEVRRVHADGPVAERQRLFVGHQPVLTLDLVEAVELDAASQDRLVQLAADAAHDSDVTIIADEGLGLLSAGVVDRLVAMVRERSRVLAGEVPGERHGLRRLQRMDLLCTSERSVRRAYGLFDEALPAVAWKLLGQTRSRSAIMNLGADGLIAFERLPDAEADPGEWKRRVRSEHVPSLAPYALDPLGSSGALLGASALALACGAELIQASMLGALASSCASQRLGNLPVSASDLRHAVVRLHTAHLAVTPAGGAAGGRPAGAGSALRAG